MVQPIDSSGVQLLNISFSKKALLFDAQNFAPIDLFKATKSLFGHKR
jgi:hypothetical protein